MHRPLKMPPISHRAVEEALANFERIKEQLAEQHKLITLCEQRHASATVQAAGEHAALVGAALRGEPEPARSGSDTALAVSEARQRAVVLTDALDRAREAIDEAVRDNLSALQGAAEKRRDKDLAAYLDALAKLRELSSALDSSSGEVRWFVAFRDDPVRASWPSQARRTLSLYSHPNAEVKCHVSEVLEMLSSDEVARSQPRDAGPHRFADRSLVVGGAVVT